jgi:hypothetical protein
MKRRAMFGVVAGALVPIGLFRVTKPWIFEPRPTSEGVAGDGSGGGFYPSGPYRNRGGGGGEQLCVMRNGFASTGMACYVGVRPEEDRTKELDELINQMFADGHKIPDGFFMYLKKDQKGTFWVGYEPV